MFVSIIAFFNIFVYFIFDFLVSFTSILLYCTTLLFICQVSFWFFSFKPIKENQEKIEDENEEKIGIKTGRGVKRESLKTKDIEFVRENYGLDVNDDEADAICIGHSVVQQLDEEINWG